LDNPVTRKVIYSRDVIWAENAFYYPPRLAGPSLDTDPAAAAAGDDAPDQGGAPAPPAPLVHQLTIRAGE
jgi:hypothetical protein